VYTTSDAALKYEFRTLARVPLGANRALSHEFHCGCFRLCALLLNSL